MPPPNDKTPEELLQRLGRRLRESVAQTRPLGPERMAQIREALRQGVEQSQKPSASQTPTVKTEEQTSQKSKDKGPSKDKGQSHGH
jgi:hypothetical protein